MCKETCERIVVIQSGACREIGGMVDAATRRAESLRDIYRRQMDDDDARTSIREMVQRPGSSSQRRVGEEGEGQGGPLIAARIGTTVLTARSLVSAESVEI